MANKTYGDVIYGVNDCKVAAFGTTTAYDLYGIQSVAVEITNSTAELLGDDTTIAQISLVMGGTATIRNAAFSDEALEIITGKTFSATSSSPTEVNTLVINGADNFPYVLIGVKANDDDGGDIHHYLWKAKLTGGLNFTFENGSWVTPEMVFSLAQDADNSNRLVSIVQHETATALSFS